MDTDIDTWPSSSRCESSSKWASTSNNWESSPWHTSPMLSSTASDDDHNVFEQQQLTLDCRPRPHSPVPPFATISPSTPPQVAISVPAHNNNSTQSQDVRLLNTPASFRPPSPAPRFHGFSATPLESPLSSPAPDKHVAINTDSNRLRTSQVFASTQDLAAHYGIPQNLPPPPRPVVTRPSKPSTTTAPPHDFKYMCSNYLTMLAQNTDTTAAVAPATVAPRDLESEMKALGEYIGIPRSLSRRRPNAHHRAAASPEFRSLGDSFDTSPVIADDDALFSYGDDSFGNESPLFSDSPFLTSPHDTSLDDFGTDFGTSPLDTPFSEFMPTPVMGMLGDDMMAPLISDRGYDENAPLFGDADAGADDNTDAFPAPKLPSTDNMWTISPGTPAIDAPPSSFNTHKNRPVIPPSPPRRRAHGVTGTRKNLTPAALIPLDAPTQKRTYATPSATSRKVVPAVFKKRLHSAAFGDDADEELGELSPTASEAETIEYKRRQNTIAARKSRKRKLEHQQMLEEEVATLKGEVAVWRERALMGQEMLKSHGIMLSFDGTQP
ncbi:hypothetical protein B0H11DRAFT_1972996 [Mycena galericulata]|nr:hypothetical protein B0H11DRAFT_1972996 [Mycena galericulata]